MGYYDDDRYDRYREDERRRYEDREQSDEEALLAPFFIIAGVFIGALLIAGVLDNLFGWGLTPWVQGLIGRVLGGGG